VIILVGVGDAWRYIPAPEAPNWRDPDFDDSAWPSAPSGFGYGDDDDATLLPEMKGHFVALALRRRFDASAEIADQALTLVIRSDDGFVAWLNGKEIARARVQGPPAPDALAEDHEATRAERFAVPAGLLRAGANVLCVQAHNSDLASSDFTIEPQLVIDAQATPPRGSASPARSTGTRTGTGAGTREGARFSTTLGAFSISNYFQGRAGTAKEAVFGQVLREEARLRVRDSRLSLTLRAGVSRFGSLGVSPEISVRASWRWDRHEAWVSGEGQWNRPAFRLGTDLARSRSAGIEAGWLVRLPHDVSVSAWIAATRESVGLDANRNNRDSLAGVAVRLMRSRKAFSPEIGIEAGSRRAGARSFEYDQRRVFVRLRSNPSERVALTAFLRSGLRDYALDRSDRRRVVRVTCDIRLREALDLVTYASWEDGQSSLDGRAFEGTTAWAGVRLSH